jgi:hypothetical protein
MQRRAMLASTGIAALAPAATLAATATMPKFAALDDGLLTAVLEASGWSETADDNGGGERLPSSFVGEIVAEHASRPDGAKGLAGLGILVLTLSVGEWGIAWEGGAPVDPAKQGWKGPASIGQGKHLMSYALGGIGLPHLDVAGAETFFAVLTEKVPEAKDDLRQLASMPGGFRYDTIRARGGVCAADPEAAVITTDLAGQKFQHAAPTLGGPRYCTRFNAERELDAQAWQKLRHWCRVGLRRRDMQEWIVLDWLNDVWVRAYSEVMRRSHGTVPEALVVARMWNSSKGDALKGLAAAGDEPDPQKRIALELASYAARSETNQGRVGLMQRPSAAYGFLAPA